MSKPIFITLLLFILVPTIQIEAQDCKHLFDLSPPLDSLYTTKQDKLLEMTDGKTIKLVRILYGTTNYSLTVTKNNPSEKIGIKIIDGRTQKTIWDNSLQNYKEEIDIKNDASRRVIIEITSLAEHEKEISECIVFTIRSYKNYEPTKFEQIPSPPKPKW